MLAPGLPAAMNVDKLSHIPVEISFSYNGYQKVQVARCLMDIIPVSKPCTKLWYALQRIC